MTDSPSVIRLCPAILINGIFDPAIVARGTKVDRHTSIYLIHQLLLRQLAHLLWIQPASPTSSNYQG